MKKISILNLSLSLVITIFFTMSAYAQQNNKVFIELVKPGTKESKSYEISGWSLNFFAYYDSSYAANEKFFSMNFGFKKQIDNYILTWLASREQTMNGKISIKSLEDGKITNEYEFEKMKITSYNTQDYDGGSNDYFSVSVEKLKINGVQINTPKIVKK